MLSHISMVSVRRATWQLALVFAWAFLIVHTATTSAFAISNWDGSDDTNWATANNWDVAPGAGDDLVFSATGQTFQPLNNDIVGGSFNSVTFDADVFTNDVGGDNLLTVTGNAFDLGAGGILASSIGAGRTIDVQNNITMTSATSFTNSLANTTLIVSGAVSGGFQLSKGVSTGTVRLTGNSSFTGGFFGGTGNGVLEFTSLNDSGVNSALGASGTVSIRSLIEYVGTAPGGHTSNRSLQFGNGGSGYNFLNASGVGPLTLSGTVGFGAARNVQLGGTGVGIITGVLSASGAATYSLNKVGSGTWVFSGAAANNITRARIQGGTLILAKNNALGTGTTIPTNEALIQSGTTLGFQGNVNYLTATPVLVSGAGDAGNSRAGAIDNISGTNTFAGQITLAGNTTLGATAGQLTLNGLIAEDLISNSYAITKNGPGTIVFNRAAGNSYQGGTLINQGTLLVTNTSNSASGSGAVTVGSAGTLKGNGIIAGAIQLNGTVSPGLSPGMLTALSNMSFESDSEYLWEINDWTGTQSTNYDYLNIGGSLAINATSGNPFVLDITSLDNLNLPGPVANYEKFLDSSWVIAKATGGITGLTSNNYKIELSNFQHLNPGTFSLSLTNGATELLLSYTAPPIPEPSTISLLGMSLLVVLARRRNQ